MRIMQKDLQGVKPVVIYVGKNRRYRTLISSRLPDRLKADTGRSSRPMEGAPHSRALGKHSQLSATPQTFEMKSSRT